MIFHMAHQRLARLGRAQSICLSLVHTSSSEFPGIFARDDGYFVPRLTPDTHPHLRLEENMTSVPAVKPGDMVFWHCDVVHSVEQEHKGNEDSAGM